MANCYQWSYWQWRRSDRGVSGHPLWHSHTRPWMRVSEHSQWLLDRTLPADSGSSIASGKIIAVVFFHDKINISFQVRIGRNVYTRNLKYCTTSTSELLMTSGSIIDGFLRKSTIISLVFLTFSFKLFLSSIWRDFPLHYDIPSHYSSRSVHLR